MREIEFASIGNPERTECKLEVVNTSNGCSAMTSTLVSQDTVAPTVTIADPATLNCNVAQTNLDANGSSQGSSFSYLWTSSNGNILNVSSPKVKNRRD